MVTKTSLKPATAASKAAAKRTGARKGKPEVPQSLDGADEDVAPPIEGRQDPRRRDRERTLFELQLALHRLQKREEKITLAAVSKEAGVSPALMHNRYPDFAEQVRAIIGKGVRQQRDDKASELLQAKERIKELNQKIAEQLKQITQLASVNEQLVKEMAIQKAIADGKVTRGQFGRQPSETDPLNSPPKN